jgi:hypothetical protein
MVGRRKKLRKRKMIKRIMTATNDQLAKFSAMYITKIHSSQLKEKLEHQKKKEVSPSEVIHTTSSARFLRNERVWLIVLSQSGTGIGI